MADNKRYVRNKHISLVQQQTALLASYSGAKCIIENATLIWSAEAKPTPNSRDYHMVLSYRLWERPSVYISGDSLRKLDAIDFPHKYSVDVEKKLVEICLYRYKEFTVYNYLSKTIVPWAIEWLFFYEIWLATGEWCGGGEHPDIGKEKSDEDQLLHITHSHP